MGTYKVYLSAYFSDSVEVEADSEQEATDLAIQEFSDDFSTYSSSGGYTIPFDDVQVDTIEYPEDEDAN